MNYKQKSDEIKIAIILVKNKSTSKNLRYRKLCEIADLSEMYNYGDNTKSIFVEESLKMQRLNQQVKWIRYLKNVLLEMERYEILHFLNL